MRKALPVFIAVCLILSLCAGVFAPVPKARADVTGMVDLGTAKNYVIFAEAAAEAITTTVGTYVYGNIGVSSVATAITGFDLAADSTNVFSKSVLVSGNVYAFDYADPTPYDMTTAAGDLYNAYTDAYTRPAAVGAFLNIGGGTVTSQTLVPGLYTWGTNVVIPTAANITLDAQGDTNAVWVFQISGTLDLMDSGSITLADGANGANIFWQVTGAVTLHPSSHFEGNILAATNIAMQDNASINGRLLSQTAVTLIDNNISPPTSAPVSPVVPRDRPPVVVPPVVVPPVVVPPVVPITTVYHQTFFIGYPDGTFKPDRNVSRAEVAAALTRALGLGWSNTTPSYPDVPATHWAAGDIQIMKDEGIMIGDTSGTFRPDAPITRAEAAATLLRMLKVAPIQNLTASSFKDVPVTNWAVGYIEAMQKNGYITGYPDGTYKPTVNILRSEFTAIADRTLGREIGNSSQVTGLGGSVVWPDVPTTQWAYLYILEASTPHTVTNAVKLDRTIVLTSKTLLLFSDGTSIVTVHKAGDVLTAIVPVDGLLPNGSVPAARQVTVAITIKLKP